MVQVVCFHKPGLCGMDSAVITCVREQMAAGMHCAQLIRWQLHMSHNSQK